jgi:hypothetical protein
MKFNKNVLVAAIAGTLFAAGNAAAVDFTNSPATGVAEFAKEIKTSATLADATIFSGVGLQIDWVSGYAYSPEEVRYVRIEAPAHVVFQAGTAVAVRTAGGGAASTDLVPGAINGLGSNVLYFSVTADDTNGAAADLEFRLTAVAKVTEIKDADVKISLYDQPSQANNGGTTGLIAAGSVSGDYFKFKNSLSWDNDPNTRVSDVEADPSFTLFEGGYDYAYLNDYLAIVDNGTRAADSTFLGVADLVDTANGQSWVHISGDWSWVATEDGFDDAGSLNNVYWDDAAEKLTATKASFDLNNGYTSYLYAEKDITADWNTTIAESEYFASLEAKAKTPAAYNAPTLPEVKVGEIVRNGTELQAPLAQIPAGWLSRLVLTNTSGAERSYNIQVLTEAGVTVTEGTLTGTIPANGTKVIDDLKTVFTGSNRATLVVNVAGPDNAIQGLYQIVNPEKGSISNHVLVRPGSN